MQVVELINSPKIAQAATEMAQNLGYVWALKEAKFWYELWTLMEEKSEKIGWRILGYEIMFHDDNFIEDEKERALKIAQARASKDEGIGIVCEKIFENNEVAVDIYQYNTTGLRYYLKSSKDIDNMAKYIGTIKKDKENRYGDSEINVKFYGKNVNNPSYELFDDAKLKQLARSVADEAIKKLEKINQILLLQE
ncbi:MULTISPECIES: hypothetical protein [unclassified Sulfurospirillum]|uniref:hypothetical protein n=1 Tax=unclassified Sulfurospirillum TaxID=2618290 RepID=UPI00068E7ECE|nr:MULTISPECIES: hypothetical protein [unclassified Sulfurospirillum]